MLRAELVPVGAHAPNDGHTPVVQFFINVKILADASTQQATILFGMLYVLIIWLFSAFGLALAFIMYITFLWHHIPSADGSLTRFCRRKIEKRLSQVVRQKVDKAIAKEHKTRIKQVATGGTGASVGMPAADFKRQPTLPVLDADGRVPPSAAVSRQTTQSNLTSLNTRPASPFGARPASPFNARPASPRPSNVSSALQREPTLPDVLGGAHRPEIPSRNTTQSSLHSNTSYGSDAPLMSSAVEMGYDPQKPKTYRNNPSRAASDRSMSSSRPPLSRGFVGLTQSNQRSASAGPTRMGATPLRPDAGVSGRNNSPAPYSSQPQGRNPVPRDPSTASFAPTQRPVPGATGLSRRPTQEYEMHPPAPSVEMSRPPPLAIGNGGYVPFHPTPPPPQQPRNFTQPYLPSSKDYFGESWVPPRVGTAPAAQNESYDDSIYDAYGAEKSRRHPDVPFRPATTGPGGGGGARRDVNGSKAPYNPPKF